jgi:hypothetical protein
MAGSVQQQWGAQILLITSSFQFSENFEEKKKNNLGFQDIENNQRTGSRCGWFLGNELEGWVVGLVWVL